MRLPLPLALGIVLGSAGAGCSAAQGTGHVTVHLTDAPGPYENVWVDVTGLAVHVTRGSGGHGPAADDSARGARPASEPAPAVDDPSQGEGGGWVAVAVARQRIDLLTLQDGVELDLAAATVPAGAYDGVRLVVAGATVVAAGAAHALVVPSGSERGIQAHAPFAVGPGATTDLLLDLDAAASIHEESEGRFTLQPVLTVKAIR